MVFVAVAGVFPGTALAATGEGTATIRIAVDSGSQNASTATYGSAAGTVVATVGSLSYLRIDLTVGASHIAASQNNVTIQIPTNLFPANGFGTNEQGALTSVNAVGEFFIGYTDTDAGTTDNSAISFSASAATDTGLITVQADQQMDSTDIISVYAAVKDLNYVRTAQTATISVDDAGGNSLVAIGASPTVSTQAADAGASVTLGTNAVVHSYGNTTLTLTTPFVLDAADTIDITFPAHMDVSGVASAVTGTFEATDSITCAAVAQVVTCTTSAATNATGTIIMTGIRASTVSATNVTSVEVEDEGVGANDIATDTSVSMTDSRRRTAGTDTTTTTPITYDIHLTAPVVGASYAAGSPVLIEWTTGGGVGTVGAVNLLYSVNGGTDWTSIATNTENDVEYSWTAPSVSSTHVLIRAQATDLVTVLDTDTTSEFSITGGATVVETPAVTPTTPAAAGNDAPTGAYIKGTSSSAVYALAADGTRRPFLDAQTYFTYESNFDKVVTVSDTSLASHSLGRPMLPKAGTVLVKVQSTNGVYLVTGTNTLRWISTEEVAKVLFGTNWADYVIDVPVTAWSQFDHTGEDINTTTDVNVTISDMKTRTWLNTK